MVRGGMPARVIVIGLDATEATLVERWAAEGRLPTFARLMADGAAGRLGNPLETLPGAIWPEITSGRSCGKVAEFYHPRQIHTGETRMRRIEPDEVDPSTYFWSIAASAGCRVAAVDLPHTILPSGLNGLQVLEWGLHDRNFAIESEPAGLIDELRSRYGDHPVDSCDAIHGRTESGYELLVEKLLDGAARKEALLLDLLGRENWDLFVCAFAETHCAGHQLWHYHEAADAGEPVPAHLAEAIPTVYRRVDEAVGKLLDAAGENSTALVFLSHGMGHYIGGYQLLPEFLVRIGAGSGGGALAQTRTRLPGSVRSVLRRLVPGRSRRRFQQAAGSLAWPLESARTKAIAVPNNRVGAIRLNVKGREPTGSLEPGPEVEAFVAELRRELYALEDPVTGERIVDRVVTAEEAFGPEHHPDVPDVMVVFRTDLGTIVECRSPRVGHLSISLEDPNTPRTGDHTVESQLWAIGPGITAGLHFRDANVLDIAPTALELLGVRPPETLDGRSLLGSPSAV